MSRSLESVGNPRLLLQFYVTVSNYLCVEYVQFLVSDAGGLFGSNARSLCSSNHN